MKIIQKSVWLIGAAILALSSPKSFGQAKSFAAGDLTYTQNFDGMGVMPGIGSYPTGWTAIRGAGSGAANATLTVATTKGDTTSGGVYSVGTKYASDRAFGTLASGTTVPYFGASFQNTTGAAITDIAWSGVMEQWKSGSNSSVNEITAFEYSLNATSLSTGTWVAVSSMDLLEKLTATTTAAAVDGNLTANKTNISGSVSALSWANNSTLWIRWKDVDNTGSDGIYAIDDFSMTVTPAAAACSPTQLALKSITVASPTVGQTFSITVESQTSAGVACAVGSDLNVTLSTNLGAIVGTATVTIPNGSTSATFTGISLTQAGAATLTATGASFTNATQSVTVQEAASQLVFGSVPSSGTATNMVSSFTVTAKRSDNSTDNTYGGSITISKASGPGTLGGTLTKTASSGVATFNDITFSTAGTYTLLATATSVAGTVTSTNIVISVAPVMTEAFVPQYWGMQNVTTPMAVGLRISNLQPNTSYDVRVGLDTLGSANTSWGAGSIWSGTSYGNTNPTNVFTTDASGNSGLFWVYLRTSSNARFKAGKFITLRAAVAINGNTMPTNPMFVSTNQIQLLDIGASASTTSTTDDGAFVKVNNFLNDYAGKYVMIYNNTAGTGRPLYVHQNQTSADDNGTQASLPTDIANIWDNAATTGDFAGVVPIGANNPNGVRRVEVRDAAGNIVYTMTDADGTWLNGTITGGLTRRQVGAIAPSCNNPTSFASILGASAIKLTWDASSYNSLNLQWKAASSSTWISIPLAGTASAYRFTNLTPNTKYSFRLKARCVAGDVNANWDTLSATTLATPVCSPLSPVTVTPGATAALFTWPTYTTGTYVYQVRYRVQGSSTWTNYQSYINGLPTTAFRAIGLTPSTTYEWQIRNACMPVGEDWNDWSSLATFTTLATPSCSPLSPVTVTPAATTALFTWPTYTTGTYVYQVRYRVEGSNTWTNYQSYINGLPSTAFRATDLTPSTTYEWQIRNACMPVGEDWNDWSAIATFTTGAARLGKDLSQVNTYPNPSTGLVNVSGLSGAVQYSVYNSVGKQVMAGEQVVSEDAVLQLDLSAYPQGAYILKVVSAEGVAARQMILTGK